MSIQPVSQLNALLGTQQVQNQAGASHSQQPVDTVQLSPAAQAHLAGGDTDGDGDGH
jgi:hypothetical protein